MKENLNQLIRFDGKNCFMEVMVSAMNIGRVQMNFIEYDLTKPAKNRIVQDITIFLEQFEALVLANDILSGNMSALAKEAIEAKKKGGYRFANAIYTSMGGTSAEKLKKQGKEREDKMSESRQLKITPGDMKPWVISAETGAGKENETGLIVPQYKKPEKIIRIAMDNTGVKKFALCVKAMCEYNINRQMHMYFAEEKKKKSGN